jgi:hypothetical protein
MVPKHSRHQWFQEKSLWKVMKSKTNESNFVASQSLSESILSQLQINHIKMNDTNYCYFWP